jgi:O-acetylhomoserine/O-acetylserine sulfhydrylase-like pyridoxal-dependent enzyme
VLDIRLVSAIRTGTPGFRYWYDATVTTPALAARSTAARTWWCTRDKFLSGHGVVIGGVLVDGGAWTGSPRANSRRSPSRTKVSTG